MNSSHFLLNNDPKTELFDKAIFTYINSFFFLPHLVLSLRDKKKFTSVYFRIHTM